MICPKCQYERQPADVAPEGECPRCGVIYAKVWGKTAAPKSATWFGTLAEKAREARDNPALADTIAANKSRALETLKSGANKANELLDNHWPKIETALIPRLLAVTEETLQDDEALKSVLETSYEVLPIALRLVVSRTKFMAFAMNHRDDLLLRLQDYKNNKEGIDPKEIGKGPAGT